MMAKVIWKTMNTVSGMASVTLSRVTPPRKAFSSEPKKE